MSGQRFIETKRIAMHELQNGGELRVTEYGDRYIVSIATAAGGSLHSVTLTRDELLKAFGDVYWGILGNEIARGA